MKGKVRKGEGERKKERNENITYICIIVIVNTYHNCHSRLDAETFL